MPVGTFLPFSFECQEILFGGLCDVERFEGYTMDSLGPGALNSYSWPLPCQVLCAHAPHTARRGCGRSSAPACVCVARLCSQPGFFGNGTTLEEQTRFQCSGLWCVDASLMLQWPRADPELTSQIDSALISR